MVVWDSGQLIAIGVLITIMMNVLTEAFEKDVKITRPWMPSREKRLYLDQIFHDLIA
jgi:hypothetical protein